MSNFFLTNQNQIIKIRLTMQNIKTLVRLKDFHNKYYQEFLSEKETDIEKIKVVETFLKEAIDKNDFCIRVKIDALQSIIQDNRIKSVVELGRGGATIGGKNTRIKAIKYLFDVSEEELDVRDFPKFGYLSCKEKFIEFVGNSSMLYQYGNIILTFNKEKMFERTTLTVGNSLNFGEFLRKIPTFISDPKVICIKGKPRQNTLDIPIDFSVKSRHYYINKFYEAIMNKKLIPEKPFILPEIFNENGFEFFELQFHGDIIFDNVIQQIDYYPYSEEEEANFEKLIPLLEEKKINVNKFDFNVGKEQTDDGTAKIQK